MKAEKVRVRFAPSPTGPLHIGGLRTALYNYLYARQQGGTFVLRIEDTDRSRFVEGAQKYILEAFEWCGIEIDEGIGTTNEGQFAPYRQSERKDIYKKYIENLIAKDLAYYAFDTGEELNTIRKQYEKDKKTFQYDQNTRKTLKNSINLGKAAAQKLIEQGADYVIRIKMPENESIEVNDMIRGNVSFNSSLLDDKVLFKSDGMPTYHLANVVDDHLMQITHVIRGEEWLPSAPLHVLLYQYLGWGNEIPVFAHLPLLLKPSGKGKLSKRDGDKLGFPVFPLNWTDPKTKELSRGYREDGYFSEAVVNILAFLGWNPGTEKEIYSIDELIHDFSLEKVGKSGARFDPEKAKWFNQHYLRQKNNEELARLFMPILQEKGIETENLQKIAKVCELIKERAIFIADFWALSFYFFTAPTEYDAKVVKKIWKSETPDYLKNIIGILNSMSDYEPLRAEEQVKKRIKENNLPMGKIMNAIRLSLVGKSMGPGLFDIINIIGKDEAIKRIETAMAKLQ